MSMGAFLSGGSSHEYAAFKKAISISTEYVYALIGLTASYSMAGRMEEARPC